MLSPPGPTPAAGSGDDGSAPGPAPMSYSDAAISGSTAAAAAGVWLAALKFSIRMARNSLSSTKLPRNIQKRKNRDDSMPATRMPFHIT